MLNIQFRRPYFSAVFDGKPPTVAGKPLKAEEKPLKGKGRPIRGKGKAIKGEDKPLKEEKLIKWEEKPSTGEEQTAILENIEGVVSRRSVESLLQWLYSRKIGFDPVEPKHRISAAIEVARLAEMCKIDGLGDLMGQYIKNTLSTTPARMSIANPNTRDITREHVFAAGYLPQNHAVRSVIAAASVEGYFISASHKFAKEAREHPTFGADLLEQVRWTLHTLSCKGNYAAVDDPIDGRQVTLRSEYASC